MKFRCSMVLLALCSFFTLTVHLSEGANAPNPGAAPLPKIEIDQTSFYFGQIFSGEKATHVFKFHNSGNAPLIIDKVRQSCGCTATILSSKILQPGSGGELQATFNSTGFNGPVVKTIYLHSNDPSSPVLQLYLRGDVQPEILQKPRRVSLGKLTWEETATTKIQLTNQGKEEIALGEIKTTTPEVVAEMSDARMAPGQTITVTLSVTPQPGKRRLGGFVIIPLTGAFTRELRVPVYALVAPPAKPEPAPPATPPEPQPPAESQPPAEPQPQPPLPSEPPPSPAQT